MTGWTDILQDRLDVAKCSRPVLNAGIDGNQVAASRGTFGLGHAMDQRVGHDVLDVPGVRYVFLLGGINDIGLSTIDARARHQPTPSAAALADPVIAAQKKIIAMAHAKGLLVFGGTVLPFEQTTRTYTAQGEAAREKINAWIRRSAGFDGVVDFDAFMRDPAHPERLKAAFNSGDDLHPSDAGYRAMAEHIPLKLFGCP
ncbi:GDSL-type esterase/lipase family protein [Rhodanobacter sp. 115]|nr:GDSL-type esterase/lipase family protein [Rhodanobacter sp. 115]EIM02117.1 G-D-S-L family lipolytic protein [Rhodanobacter sp. 115]